MLKRLYRSKRFEETLGVIGLVYFFLLALITFFTVRFLIVASIDVVKPAHVSSPPPFEFKFELLESPKNITDGHGE